MEASLASPPHPFCPLLHQSGISTSSYDDEAKQASGLANSGNTLQCSAGSTDARDAANQTDRLLSNPLLPLHGRLLYDRNDLNASPADGEPAEGQKTRTKDRLCLAIAGPTPRRPSLSVSVAQYPQLLHSSVPA